MTTTERPSDAAMAQAVREQQDRGYYTGACDCIIARAREIDALRMNTHAADCYLWGVKHHECAVREIERLRTLDAAPADPVVSAENRALIVDGLLRQAIAWLNNPHPVLRNMYRNAFTSLHEEALQLAKSLERVRELAKEQSRGR